MIKVSKILTAKEYALAAPSMAGVGLSDVTVTGLKEDEDNDQYSYELYFRKTPKL